MVGIVQTVHDDGIVLLHLLQIGERGLALLRVMLEARGLDLGTVVVEVEVASRPVQIEHLLELQCMSLRQEIDIELEIEFVRGVAQ